jgi:hypothetical protein
MLFKKSKPTDIQQVHKASAWLEVSEFQVFCNAWQAWYDEQPSEKRIEPFFVNFLGQDAVPFWVRNYVRDILNRKDLLEKEKKTFVHRGCSLLYPASHLLYSDHAGPFISWA